MAAVMRPAAVVFDLDGVLVDSEGIWTAAEASTVEQLGGTYTDKLRAALHGRGHRDGGTIIAEALGRDDGPAIADVLLGHALDGMRPGVRAVDGAVELVSSLRGRVPVAVASNSVRVIVETALASAGLHGFDAVVAGEDVARAKPEPDPYLEACRRLGAEPAASLAVEDSPAGATSARAAGLYVVGLDPSGTVDLHMADRVIRSLRELEL